MLNPRFRCPGGLAAFLVLSALLAGCGKSVDGNPPPPAPAEITVVSGGPLADTVAAPKRTLTVTVRGVGGQPAAGVPLVFSVPTRPGSFLAARVRLYRVGDAFGDLTIADTTNSQGVATIFLAHWATAGEDTVTITAASLGLQTRVITNTLPGNPFIVAPEPRDTAVYVGGSYALRVYVGDQFNNPRTDPLTYTAMSPAASVSGATVKGESIGQTRIAITGGGITNSAFVSVVPRGTVAVHLTDSSGQGDGLAIVDLDGSGMTKVVPEAALRPYPPVSAGAPQWLPGGASFVFPQGGHLFVAALTGAIHPLLPGPSATLSETDAAVSPDGAWVYFVGQQDATTFAVWRVHPDGTGAQAIPGPTMRSIRWLTVSPEGARIAYVARNFEGEYHLFVRAIATGATAQVGPNEAAGARWAPSGERIVYALSGASDGYSGVLHVVNADGSGDRDLTAGPFFPGVDWSPDGKYVVGVRADMLGSGFRVIDVATGEQLPIVMNGTWSAPAWRR